MEEIKNILTDIMKYLDTLHEQVLSNSEFLLSLANAVDSAFNDMKELINVATGIVIENAERLDVLEMMIDTNRELIYLQNELLATLSKTTLFSLGLGIVNTLAISALALYIFFKRKK